MRCLYSVCFYIRVVMCGMLSVMNGKSVSSSVLASEDIRKIGLPEVSLFDFGICMMLASFHT